MNIACFTLVLLIVRQQWVDAEYKVIPRLRVLEAFEKALQFAKFRRWWVEPQCANIAVFPPRCPFFWLRPGVYQDTMETGVDQNCSQPCLNQIWWVLHYPSCPWWVGWVQHKWSGKFSLLCDLTTPNHIIRTVTPPIFLTACLPWPRRHCPRMNLIVISPQISRVSSMHSSGGTTTKLLIHASFIWPWTT